MMQWTRSEALVLAKQRCALCLGTGLRPGKPDAPAPCNCVLRAIFRACYQKFRCCAEKEKHLSTVSLERTQGTQNRCCWGRKDEEYVADFMLVSRRALSEPEYTLFKFHFLLGAGWKLCCRRLNMDRGTFFHTVYRIEQKLGRIYRELEPYSLFPIDQYFGGTVRTYSDPPRKGPARAQEAFPLRRLAWAA